MRGSKQSSKRLGLFSQGDPALLDMALVLLVVAAALVFLDLIGKPPSWRINGDKDRKKRDELREKIGKKKQ